jgi:glycosyltransferase involved in cell wall biosynthesis
MKDRPTILHITSDYPDCVNQVTTHAVYNLIHNATACNHLIYSLNRRGGETQFIMDDTCTAVTYPGLPYGVGMRHSLQGLAKLIGERLLNERPFDLIHAHKLTIEGIVAHELSRLFHKPMIATVRGETDLRIMRLKPSCRKLYRRIIDHSSALFFLAPWTRLSLSRRTGIDLEAKGVMLPNITFCSRQVPPPAPGHSSRFVTTCRFNAKNFVNKRMFALVKGFNAAAGVLADITLDIVGMGESAQREKLLRVVRSLKNGNRIRIIENMDNTTFCETLPCYAAFLRPSYPETFGMVFVESLFAGVPILLSRNTAIDGYFPGAPFAVAVDHRAESSIADAIITLYRNQIDFKQQLAAYLAEGKLDAFRHAEIVGVYAEAVCGVVGSRKGK